MTPERLRILCVSHLPPTPPRFGAQARIHGLWTSLARRHDLTAVTLADEEFDVEESRRALAGYCREAMVLPNPRGKEGVVKRVLQLRSLAGRHSFEHLRYDAPGLQEAIDGVMQRGDFDVVHLEFPYLAHLRFRQRGPGGRVPPLVIDTHEIAWDMVRQFSRTGGPARRAYAALDWRKLRREERAAFLAADGICACSAADQERILAEAPSARTVVVPNAADVEHYRPRPDDPRPDGRTVVFFGLMSTTPNIDGALWFLREIWPRIAAARPDARCRILGKGTPQSVRDLAGPRVEIAGFVEDLRPHLAAAAALVVPLRLGGGTRLKIVEGLAMSKAIVSTRLGAEGIDAVHEQSILLADEPESFARCVTRVLDDPALAARLGEAGRALAVERYAWSAAALSLESFYRELGAAQRAQPAGGAAEATG